MIGGKWHPHISLHSVALVMLYRHCIPSCMCFGCFMTVLAVALARGPSAEHLLGEPLLACLKLLLFTCYIELTGRIWLLSSSVVAVLRDAIFERHHVKWLIVHIGRLEASDDWSGKTWLVFLVVKIAAALHGGSLLVSGARCFVDLCLLSL